MRQTTERRPFHLKVSERLFDVLEDTARQEGRGHASRQAEYDLEVILPIDQAETRFRFVPRRLDFGPFVCELTLRLALEYFEFLCERARSSGLSVNEQARQYLWFVAERRRKLYPKGSVLLLKEEFRRRIQEYLNERFAKIQ